jgi:hypothetical protein
MKPPIPLFNAFTIKYNGRSDRILTDLYITVAYDPAKPPTPAPSSIKTIALWDTGATRSVITKDTANSLGLIPVGNAMVSHAGGTSQANTYMVNFILPNNVGVAGVLVSECLNIIANNAGAIIGMDIITKGDFSITNVGGLTWMSYRFPSIGQIDYVNDANKLKSSGIGRNDPCPCGSGKKYKKCCGKNI